MFFFQKDVGPVDIRPDGKPIIPGNVPVKFSKISSCTTYTPLSLTDPVAFQNIPGIKIFFF